MIVFKSCFKIANKYKGVILLYTIILALFSSFNVQNNDNTMNFTSSKPDILIINEDESIGITEFLVSYIKNNANIKEVAENLIDDSLFYRDVNYIIYIPKNFRTDFLSGKNPKIEVKSTGDYQASLADMILNRFIKLSSFYRDVYENEEKIIENVKNVLESNIEVTLTKEKDTYSLDKAVLYYNFANYAILAGCIYVICLILSSFKDIKISKRTIISSMNYKKFNINLLISNGIIALIIWFIYVVISFVLVGKVMFTSNGLLLIANSFVFLISAISIAFLIGNVINNKEAMNGIVNVIALGSSFLCGSFVPLSWLPDSVLKIAHILPSYYYIKNNDLIGETIKFNLDALSPILENMLIMLLFMILFIIITNLISRSKRKIA